MPLIKKIMDRLEYAVFRALCFVNNALPSWATRRIARGLAPILFGLLSKRRWIALGNLRMAFGRKKTESEIYRIGVASMVNLLETGSEFARVPQILKDPRRYIRIDYFGRVIQELEKGKGVITLIAHYGNWEMMALPVMLEGYSLSAIARPLKNSLVNRYVTTLRRAMGIQVIEKDGAVGACIQALKKNQIVAMLIDQHERRGGVWVDYFGREASTSSLPAALALKYGVAVLPVFSFRQRDGFIVVEVQEACPLIQTGNLDNDIHANTSQYVKRIEEVVRNRPTDWLWMHRRWRPRPESAGIC